MREAIRRWDLDPDVEAVLLTALMRGRRPGGLDDGRPDGVPEAVGAARAQPAVARAAGPCCPAPAARCRQEAWEAAATEVGSRLPRPAVQPAQLPLELPRLGDARAVGRARRPTAWRASATDCRTHKSPFNSKPGIRPGLRARARRAAVAVRPRLLQRRGAHRPRRDGGDARRARPRHGLRGGPPALRRRTDRDLQPPGEKVGRVGRLTNRERLFLLDRAGRAP